MRTLLVDDNRLYLRGLRHLLEAGGFQVVGIAEDALEARVKARVLRPDLIIVDAFMPGPCAIEAVCRIKAELPEALVVMLSVCGQEEGLLRGLRCGATGYLLKSDAGLGLRAMLSDAGTSAGSPANQAG